VIALHARQGATQQPMTAHAKNEKGCTPLPLLVTARSLDRRACLARGDGANQDDARQGRERTLSLSTALV
jgi:hypothetical protein